MPLFLLLAWLLIYKFCLTNKNSNMEVSNKDYEKSNQITEVSLSKFRSNEYDKLLKDGNRLKDAQALIDYLCDKFHLPKVQVIVLSRRQQHSTDGKGRLKSKTYGYYTPNLRTITIFNLTAIKGEVISIKQFADTLLHEFMHHYDLTSLKLGSTPHTAGFYKRISDLQSKLSK